MRYHILSCLQSLVDKPKFKGGCEMNGVLFMTKQMAATSIQDLITFLRLFPAAELICDADSGVMTVELNDAPAPFRASF